jgi:hypothetical protein
MGSRFSETKIAPSRKSASRNRKPLKFNDLQLKPSGIHARARFSETKITAAIILPDFAGFIGLSPAGTMILSRPGQNSVTFWRICF